METTCNPKFWSPEWTSFMRRSREVPVSLLAAFALSITSTSLACNDERKDCVDAQGHILPDSACHSGFAGAHYVYGGRSGGHNGDTVFGGSSSEEGVARGGFGHGGGEGGE
jgi:hypothetical protein